MSVNKPITVTLGEMQPSIDRRLASGDYGSASEVIRAGLRALDREDAVRDDAMRDQIQTALSSPGADLAAEDVFDQLRTHHQEQMTAGRRES